MAPRTFGTFPRSGHPATVEVGGTGKTAITYAGDTLNNNFVHENAIWYYKNVLGEQDKNNYKIRVIRPK